MRAAVFCALARLVAALALAAAPCASGADCGPGTGEKCVRTKPSSFAPHHDGRSHVYGTPIQSRILKSRPKPTPKLKTTPLSDSQPTASPASATPPSATP